MPARQSHDDQRLPVPQARFGTLEEDSEPCAGILGASAFLVEGANVNSGDRGGFKVRDEGGLLSTSLRSHPSSVGVSPFFGDGG